jgi:hypothetical protein
MNIVLITLNSTTPCPNPIWKIQINLTEALMICAHITQQTKAGEWYFHTQTITHLKPDIELMDVKKFNALFSDQFIPEQPSHENSPRPVG